MPRRRELSREEEHMKEIIDKFNETFSGDAHASLENNTLEITVGTKTMTIELPSVVGVKSTGSLSDS